MNALLGRYRRDRPRGRSKQSTTRDASSATPESAAVHRSSKAHAYPSAPSSPAWRRELPSSRFSMTSPPSPSAISSSRTSSASAGLAAQRRKSQERCLDFARHDPHSQGHSERRPPPGHAPRVIPSVGCFRAAEVEESLFSWPHHWGKRPSSSPNQSAARSSHRGFAARISATFFSRRQFLICFSRSMA